MTLDSLFLLFFYFYFYCPNVLNKYVIYLYFSFKFPKGTIISYNFER